MQESFYYHTVLAIYCFINLNYPKTYQLKTKKINTISRSCKIRSGILKYLSWVVWFNTSQEAAGKMFAGTAVIFESDWVKNICF